MFDVVGDMFMKHACKFIPLLATLVLTGCNTPVNNGAVDQNAWDAFFGQSASNFLSQNLTMDATDGEYSVKVEIDENKIHIVDYKGEDEYFVLTPLTEGNCAIDCIKKKNDLWSKSTSIDSYESFFIESFFPFSIGYGNLKYEDFVEKDGVYTLDKIECELYSWNTYTVEDIKIAFANNKLSSISFKYTYEDHDGVHTSNTSATFSKYGSTSFTIPEVIEQPLVSFNVEEGVEGITVSAFNPLSGDSTGVYNRDNAKITNASFNHNTLYGSDLLESLKGAQEQYYQAFLFELSFGGETELDLEKSFATAYPAIDESKLNFAKSFRIGFIMEDSAFVYAPLQVKEKCSYSSGDSNNPQAQYKEGEIFDKNDTLKVSLPAEKSITVIMWFDGWDENCVNEALMQEVYTTLTFTL